MVDPILLNPIYIIAIGLGTAFFLGFFKKGKTVGMVIMLAALGVMTFISVEWFRALAFYGETAREVFTAGFNPPFSISLLMGKYEAFFALLVNSVGLLGGLYMFDRLKKVGNHAMSVYIVFIMGLNGIILTRDIFNLFVFLEIVAIATAGLVALMGNIKTFSAGFKYMIATSLISGFLLIGIISKLLHFSRLLKVVIIFDGGVVNFLLVRFNHAP